jgi:hypothetical protein
MKNTEWLKSGSNFYIWIFYGINGFFFGDSIGTFISNSLWEAIKDICYASLEPDKMRLVLDLSYYKYIFNMLMGILVLTLTLCIKLIYHHVKSSAQED